MSHASRYVHHRYHRDLQLLASSFINWGNDCSQCAAGWYPTRVCNVGIQAGSARPCRNSNRSRSKHSRFGGTEMVFELFAYTLGIHCDLRCIATPTPLAIARAGSSMWEGQVSWSRSPSWGFLLLLYVAFAFWHKISHIKNRHLIHLTTALL